LKRRKRAPGKKGSLDETKKESSEEGRRKVVGQCLREHEWREARWTPTADLSNKIADPKGSCKRGRYMEGFPI